jgi:hypothetical protein
MVVLTLCHRARESWVSRDSLVWVLDISLSSFCFRDSWLLIDEASLAPRTRPTTWFFTSSMAAMPGILSSPPTVLFVLAAGGNVGGFVLLVGVLSGVLQNRPIPSNTPSTTSDTSFRPPPANWST